MSRGDKLFIFLSLLLVLGFTLWQVTSSHKHASRQLGLPDYSTVSARSEGTKALWLLAEESGLKPQRWYRSLLRLDNVSGILITYGGTRILPEEVDAAKAWVEAGNTLVLAGIWMEWADFPSAVAVAGKGELTTGRERVEVQGFTMGFQSAPGLEVHASVESNPVIVGKRVGKGYVYGIADPSVLTNEKLGLAHNAAILDLLARHGEIYFDEYHLGLRESTSPFDLMPPAVRTAFWLAVVLLALAILKSGARFGRVYEDIELEEHRSAAELSWSLGAFLRKANASQVALQELVRQFREESGLGPQDPLHMALRGVVPDDHPHTHALKKVQSLSGRKIDDQGVVEAANILNQAKNLIREAKGGRLKSA